MFLEDDLNDNNNRTEDGVGEIWNILLIMSRQFISLILDHLFKKKTNPARFRLPINPTPKKDT